LLLFAVFSVQAETICTILARLVVAAQNQEKAAARETTTRKSVGAKKRKRGRSM
jgi:hypothetical protein